jgi:hypothetical protein
MPRRSAPSELSNVYDRLHNLDDEYVLEFRANYLFMKQAPMYVSLEKKYKETKKKNRELKRMIDLLNRQNMELMERFAGQRYLETTTECMLSERFSKLSKESEQSKPESEVEIVSVKKENIVYEIIDESEPEPEPEPESEPDQTEEEVVEESEEVVEESEEVVEEEVVEEEVVEEEVVEESEEVVEESEDVVEEESEEVVEEESEEVVEEESEEVVEESEEVVEESEEVVEESEEVVEEEVVEDQEEEEEGVYEITINETRYYVSNETDSAIYAVAEDDEIGDEVGAFVNGKATFHKEQKVEDPEEEVFEEEEEEGVYEITINGKRYYVSNETDSTIYEVAEDDEIGEEVGAFVNGVAKLN